MIKDIKTYLKTKRDEIFDLETIEKAVLIYLYQRFFGAKAKTWGGISFHDEEKLAFWGYVGLPDTRKEDAQKTLLSVLGKKKVKEGMHFSDRPLLLAGLFLLAQKLSDSTTTETLTDTIKENFEKFSLFDQFLLHITTDVKISDLHSKIKKEDPETLLIIYALSKISPGSIKDGGSDLRDLIIKKVPLLIITKETNFRDVFLIEFFLNEEMKRVFKYKEHDAKSIVRTILINFHHSILKIVEDRRKDHPVFEVKDEYDVQDLLYVILKPLFADLTPEDNTPKLGGRSKRIDLVIPSENIVIEAKIIKSGDIVAKFIDQLNVDISTYHKHPNTKHLFGFVYDPLHKVKNPHNFYALNGERSYQGNNYEVEIIVNPL